MIRILSLLWTLMLALITSGISFFYIRDEMRGFPFTFAREKAGLGVGNLDFQINIWSTIFDIIFWWLLFSVLWLIIKNYIFER